jgi:hypothetical protein
MNIYESITNIMQESIAIGKDKQNKQQGFKYRGIDDVMNTFYPLLSKHKVFVVPEVVEQIREERLSKQGGNLIYSILKIKYTFYAEDGSYVSAVVIGEGMDSADKASNKAMAVGMKYAMFQVFCIPTEEMPDSDSETPPPSIPKREDNKQTKSEPKVEEQPQVEVMTLEKAKETTFEAKGKVYKVGECSNEQLFYLRDNIKDEELLDAVKLVLMDKARTGNITDENHN